MELIGRIKYETKGAYDPAATYRAMDVVLYSGSLWEALKDTTGNPPPENQRNEDGSPASNEFWQLFLPGALGDDYVKKTDIAKAPTETEQGKVGVVMPDGKTIQIDENGLLTGTPLNFMGTLKELQEGLTSGEITEGMIGYVKGTPDNPEDPDHPNNILIHIDDYLSLVSSNAVQNRIITAELNLIKELVEQNKQLIEETRALRASVETFGFSKICPVYVTDITEDNGFVLGALEKNPAVNGTLANIIEERTNFQSGGYATTVVFMKGYGITLSSPIFIKMNNDTNIVFWQIEIVNEKFIDDTSGWQVVRIGNFGFYLRKNEEINELYGKATIIRFNIG